MRKLFDILLIIVMGISITVGSALAFWIIGGLMWHYADRLTIICVVSLGIAVVCSVVYGVTRR